MADYGRIQQYCRGIMTAPNGALTERSQQLHAPTLDFFAQARRKSRSV
jgi:hypothetical protein